MPIKLVRVKGSLGFRGAVRVVLSLIDQLID